MCAKRGFPEILHEKAMAGMRLAMAFLFWRFFAESAMGNDARNIDILTTSLLMSQLCHTWVDKIYNGKIYHAMVCVF
jgi:hypothetical protein